MHHVRIIDLDNCIADDKHRIHLIDHDADNVYEKYHAYHMAGINDEIANKQIFQGHNNIVIFTARPNLYRMQTLRWLLDHHVPFRLLLMRPDDCEMPSAELKRGMLNQLRKHFKQDRIGSAHDDRQDVLDMYKEEGVTAHHTFIHEVNYEGVR